VGHDVQKCDLSGADSGLTGDVLTQATSNVRGKVIIAVSIDMSFSQTMFPSAVYRTMTAIIQRQALTALTVLFRVLS